MIAFRSLKSLQVAPLEGLLFWGGSLCHCQEFLLGFGVARGSTVSPDFCQMSCLSVFLVLFGTFFLAIYFFTSLLLCLFLVQGPSPSKPALRRSITSYIQALWSYLRGILFLYVFDRCLEIIKYRLDTLKCIQYRPAA